MDRLGSSVKVWSELDFRYPALLGVLLFLLVGHPLLVGLLRGSFLFDFLLAGATLAIGVALMASHSRRWVAVGLGIPAVLFSLSSHAVGSAWQLGFSVVGHLFLLGFVALAVAVLVTHVMLGATSISNKILGSVCGYLLLGIAFAVAASVLDEIQADSYQFNTPIADEAEDSSTRMNAFIYYSFVTLTTLGYGDITPISPVARILAWFEAVVGQFYIAILVAGLVGPLSNQLVARREMRDHSSRRE